MKISCLAKFLIIGTIVLGAIFYYICRTPSFFSHRIVDFGLHKVKNKLEMAQASDSIKGVVREALEEYTGYLDSNKNINMNEVGKVADTLALLLKDNTITPQESQRFKEYIEEVIKHERREEN